MTQSLTALLAEQLERLQALHELQNSETKILEQRDAPALEEITAEKAKLLSALESADHNIAQHPERNALLDAPECVALRDQIQHWLGKVQQQNDVNGQLVRLTLGRVQSLKQSLQSLHGENATTYDDKGQTRGGLSGKGIKA